jgi:diphthamide synthase subunit DPH2
MSYFEKIGKINQSIVDDETLEDITYYGLKKLLLKIDEYIKIKKSDEFNEIKKILVMKNVSFYNKVKRIKVVNKNDVVNNIILEGENNIMKEIEIYVNAAN